MTNETIRQQLTGKFGEELCDWDEPYGMLTVTVPEKLILDVLQHLYDDATLRFRFLTDMTAVHYPDLKGKELCVVYLLNNMADGVRLRLKVYVPIESPAVPTATKIFATANWLEREAYDFYGVEFIGHPNLIRIMNPEEMNYFPMRKEYALEDPTRIDKDDAMFGR